MFGYALAFLLAASTAGAGSSAADFKDVPKNHWAAASVSALADAGIVRGYPDGTFKGDQPVTRYELAVALDGLIRFIQASFQPIETSCIKSGKDWAKNSLANLRSGGYLADDSPVLKEPNKPVTAAELAQALASVSARLIELRVPEGDGEEDSEPEASGTPHLQRPQAADTAPQAGEP